MYKTLQSIEQVEDHQVLDTGCQPLLVHCNDMEYYVCKYNTRTGRADLLFREFVAASFLKIWELQVPDFAIVTLQRHHNPNSKPNIVNDIPCFGSLHNREYREVDAFINKASNAQRNKFDNKADLLKIALFDYWLSNDDRSFNNYNVMLYLVNDKYHLIPIDGGAVFHTGNQDKENYTLSVEETLLSSPFLLSVFKPKELSDEQTISVLKEKYYFYVESCRQALQNIIDEVPAEWQINKQNEYNNLAQFLFTDSWIDECWETFMEHLQLSIN